MYVADSPEWTALWQQSGSIEGMTSLGHPLDLEDDTRTFKSHLGGSNYVEQWLAKRRQKHQAGVDELQKHRRLWNHLQETRDTQINAIQRFFPTTLPLPEYWILKWPVTLLPPDGRLRGLRGANPPVRAAMIQVVADLMARLKRKMTRPWGPPSPLHGKHWRHSVVTQLLCCGRRNGPTTHRS